jgi:hypothetical protein
MFKRPSRRLIAGTFQAPLRGPFEPAELSATAIPKHVPPRRFSRSRPPRSAWTDPSKRELSFLTCDALWRPLVEISASMGIGLPGRVIIFRDMVVWLPCSWMRSLMDLRAPFVLLLLIILPMPSSPPAGANTGNARSNEGAG